MRAGVSAVRSALRRMFPMTHACSHVKCANVKPFSSLASSWRSRVGEVKVLNILLADEDERGDMAAGRIGLETIG